MRAEAIPKEEFNTLKLDFAELDKKHDELLLGKAWLENEFEQKSKQLESSGLKCAELEKRVANLQHDLDEVTKDTDILDRELLGKQFSFPFRHNMHSEGN